MPTVDFEFTPEAKDALIAAVNLVHRTGAADFEVGYLHDDVPMEEAGWWAKAQYRGARVTVEDQPSPIHAADLLARRLLTGGMCNHCKRPVALNGGPGPGRCYWSRTGDRWDRSRRCLEKHPAEDEQP